MIQIDRSKLPFEEIRIWWGVDSPTTILLQARMTVPNLPEEKGVATAIVPIDIQYLDDSKILALVMEKVTARLVGELFELVYDPEYKAVF